MTTSHDALVAAVTDLALRWRYSQQPAEIDDAQQMTDGLRLLELLQRHGVKWSSGVCSEVIAAPAITPPHSPTVTWDEQAAIAEVQAIVVKYTVVE
jgi:hypothetical protein